MKEILISRLGRVCELCGDKNPSRLTLFHILPKRGASTKLRLHFKNVLLACWFKCHYQWHHDYWIARDVIEPQIRRLKGKDYEKDLRKRADLALPLSLLKIQLRYRQLQVIQSQEAG